MKFRRAYYFARERFDDGLGFCCHALHNGICRCFKLAFVLAPVIAALAIVFAVVA